MHVGPHRSRLDIAGADDGTDVTEVSQQKVEDLGSTLSLQAIQLLQLTHLPLKHRQQRLRMPP